MGTSTTTSRFIIEEPLDQAPFGSLHRAIDTRRSPDGRSAERVALWRLPMHVGNAPLDSLLRDFGLVRALRHRGIARVYELDRDADGYFMVSEFLDGETLRNVLDHLRPERLAPDEADEVLRAIGDALAYAHDREVVHGDLRAENVLVTMDHNFVLTNFMASRLLLWQPTAASQADDVRDFAALAYELHTGERLPAQARSLHRNNAPKRLLRAIETVLQSKRHELGLREFLAAAGLDERPLEEPPTPAVPHSPSPAPAAPRFVPAEMLEIPTRRDHAQSVHRQSLWRIAVPFMGIAAIAFTLHTTGTFGGLLEAGQRLQSWSVTMLERADVETAPRSTRAPAPAAAAAATIEPDPARLLENTNAASGEGVRETDSEAPVAASAALEATVSFADQLVSARESQGVVSVEIVRKGGDGPVQVVWWTTEGTAHAREDFASFGRRVETLDTHDARRTLYIPLVSDSIAEATEYFEVHLAPLKNGARVGAVGTVQIAVRDDDY